MKIILLRGLARESEHWGNFVNILNEKYQQLAEYYTSVTPLVTLAPLKILTPSCRGCGIYFNEPAYSTIEETTDHLRQKIIERERDELFATPGSEKTIIVGLSMGGMIALDWAHRYPKDLDGVILLNSSVGGLPMTWRIRPRSLPSLTLALISSPPKREALILKRVSNDKRAYPRNIAFWQNIQKRHPISRRTILNQFRAAARFNVNSYASLSKITRGKLIGLPGLVVTSKADRLVSYRCSEYLAQLFEWPLQVHPKAGHDLPLDDPDWLVDTILTWMVESGFTIRA